MRARQQGVTLMELLIVVVVIGILSAIAYPSYRVQVLRSNRTEGKAALLHASQQLERCYTVNSSYAPAAPAPACLTLPITTENGRYQITAPTLTATTYTLQAAPQGGQAQDTQCATLSITHTGAKGVTGTAPANECWNR